MDLREDVVVAATSSVVCLTDQAHALQDTLPIGIALGVRPASTECRVLRTVKFYQGSVMTAKYLPRLL